MKIVQLESANVKRIRAVAITPQGAMVVIGGKNGQGKSSVLDSIMYALGGKTNIADVPIRRGANKAMVEVVLDGPGYTVTREFNGNGNRLTVTSKDGSEIKSPQKLLDTLVGPLSFDPLDFCRMDRKAQLATLQRIVGIDLSDLDKKRADLFADRTNVNRSLRDTQGQYADAPFHPDAPEHPVSVEALTDELQKRSAVNKENENRRVSLANRRHEAAAAKRDLDSAEARVRDLGAELARLQQRIEQAQHDVRVAKDTLDEIVNDGKAEAERVAALVDANEQEIRDQLKQAEAQNQKFRENAQREQLEKDIKKIAAEADRLTEALAEVDAEKARRLSAAKFPIPGMGFDESGVLLNGLPFDQASSAEQLRASVAMGLAMNPTLKVLLVRDGSLLDDASLTVLAEMAAAADAQVWVERVGEGKEVNVIIEDGTVREAPAPEPAGELVAK